MDLEDIVKEVIAEHLGLEVRDIKDSDDLISLGADSLGIVEIVYKIEDRLEIEIPFNANDQESLNIDTVGDAIRSVRKIVESRG